MGSPLHAHYASKLEERHVLGFAPEKTQRLANCTSATSKTAQHDSSDLGLDKLFMNLKASRRVQKSSTTNRRKRGRRKTTIAQYDQPSTAEHEITFGGNIRREVSNRERLEAKVVKDLSGTVSRKDAFDLTSSVPMGTLYPSSVSEITSGSAFQPYSIKNEVNMSIIRVGTQSKSNNISYNTVSESGDPGFNNNALEADIDVYLEDSSDTGSKLSQGKMKQSKARPISCKNLVDTMLTGNLTKEALWKRIRQFNSDEMAKVITKTLELTRKTRFFRQQMCDMGIHQSLECNYRIACNAAKQGIGAKEAYILKYQARPFLQPPEDITNLVAGRNDLRILQDWPKICTKDSKSLCKINRTILFKCFTRSHLAISNSTLLLPLKDRFGNNAGLMVLTHDQENISPLSQLLGKRLAATVSLLIQRQSYEAQTQTILDLDGFEAIHACNCSLDILTTVENETKSRPIFKMVTSEIKKIVNVEECIMLLYDEANNTLWMPVENKETALSSFDLLTQTEGGPEGVTLVEDDDVNGEVYYRLRINMEKIDSESFVVAEAFNEKKMKVLNSLDEVSNENKKYFQLLEKMFGVKAEAVVAVPILSENEQGKPLGCITLINNLGLPGRRKTFCHRYLTLSMLLTQSMKVLSFWMIQQRKKVRKLYLEQLLLRIQFNNLRRQLNYYVDFSSNVEKENPESIETSALDINRNLCRIGKDILGVKECRVWLFENDHGSIVKHCLFKAQTLEGDKGNRRLNERKTNSNSSDETSPWINPLPTSATVAESLTSPPQKDNHYSTEPDLKVISAESIKPATQRRSIEGKRLTRPPPLLRKKRSSCYELKYLICGDQKTTFSSFSIPGKVLNEKCVAINNSGNSIWFPIVNGKEDIIGMLELQNPFLDDRLSTFHKTEREQVISLLKNASDFASFCAYLTARASKAEQVKCMASYYEEFQQNFKLRLLKLLRFSLSSIPKQPEEIKDTNMFEESTNSISSLERSKWTQIWLSLITVCNNVLQTDHCTLYSFDKSQQEVESVEYESEGWGNRKKIFCMGLSQLTPNQEDVVQYAQLSGKTLRFQWMNRIDPHIMGSSSMDLEKATEGNRLKQVNVLVCPIDHELTKVEKSASVFAKLAEVDMELAFSSSRYWSTCGGCIIQFLRRIVPNHAILGASVGEAWELLNPKPEDDVKVDSSKSKSDQVNIKSNLSEFTKDEEGVANGFSGVCSLDMSNAYSYLAINRRVKEMQDFSSLLLSLHTFRSRPVEEHLSLAGEILQRRLKSDRVTFFMKQEKSNYLIAVYETRTMLKRSTTIYLDDNQLRFNGMNYKSTHEARSAVLIPNGTLGQCFANESPIVRNCAAEDDPVVEITRYGQYSIWSEICVPVITRKGRVIGAIQICNKLPWLQVEQKPSCERDDIDMQRESFNPLDMELLSETAWTVGEIIEKCSVEDFEIPDPSLESIDNVLEPKKPEQMPGKKRSIASLVPRLIGLSKAKNAILKRRDKIRKKKKMNTAQRMWLAASKLRDDQMLRKSRERSELQARSAQGSEWKEQIVTPNKTTKAAIEAFMRLRNKNLNDKDSMEETETDNKKKRVVKN